MTFYVLKLGGSLMPGARGLIRAILALADEGYSFLVVPGGGPMADQVRRIFSLGDLSEEAAHWMAILAMEQYAYFLADGTGARLTTKVRRPLGDACVEILLPYSNMQKEDYCTEHNWDYTSDSVALIIASKLCAPLIKATDVDGVILGGNVVEEISASSLQGLESCIDNGTLELLSGRLKYMSVWVLNGTDPNRFILSLKEGKGGTVIIGQ